MLSFPIPSCQCKDSIDINNITVSNETVCDGEQLTLSCHRSNRIAIHTALFGRKPQDSTKCTSPLPSYAAIMVSFRIVPRKILKEVDRHKGRHRNRKRKKKKKDETTTEDKIKIPQKEGYSVDEENNTTVLCLNDTVQSTPVGRSRDGAKGLIIDWFSSFYFVKQNREKAALYLILGICMGIICLLIIVIIKLIIRSKRKEKTKLDVTDPVNSNVIPPPSHIESPTLTRTESVDRIEVVRFEPRSSTSNGFHPHYNLRADYDNTLRTDYDRNSLLRMNYDRNPLSNEERHPLRTDFDRNTIRTDYDRETLRSQYEATRNTLRSVNFQTQAHGTLNTLNSDHGDRSLNNYYG
ncbi:hypothetical protein KUTeg_007777 [Tegillarca granosa]|uniref:Uncharacterized protein n=1 Tax=Tegillarca granosa TaxID=220873 RepID=A0ABQ9FI79_TEGGR|nr:hypothetical protein KUTeg_007777 [Tegillarca granosa]